MTPQTCALGLAPHQWEPYGGCSYVDTRTGEKHAATFYRCRVCEKTEQQPMPITKCTRPGTY
jgi:hypothetical protein